MTVHLPIWLAYAIVAILVLDALILACRIIEWSLDRQVRRWKGE